MKAQNAPCPASRLMLAALASLSLLALAGALTGCSSSEAASDDIAWGESAPDDLHHTFNASPGGRLVIDADRGAIEISTGGDETVQVAVLRRVTRGSATKAQQVIAAHKVTFDQDGATVIVRARLESGIKSWGSWGSRLRVRYVVTVPRRFDLNLKTAGGSIQVPDLTGAVVAGTSGGSIKVGAITGPVTGRTSGGSISVASATELIEARTSGGSIEVGTAQAAAKLSTSGGSIRVTEARGPLEADTSGGSIRVTQAFAAVDASTSGGSVQVGLASSSEGDCRLSTSGGHVSVSIPAGINANLDARTSGGRVKSDLPVTVQGTVKPSALEGRLGEGGRLIRLRTSGGSIHITKS